MQGQGRDGVQGGQGEGAVEELERGAASGRGGPLVLMVVLLRDKGAQVVSEVEDWVAGLGVKGLIGILETEGFLRLRDIRRVSSHVFLDPSYHVSCPDPSERHAIQGFPSVNLLLRHLLIPI